MTFLTIERVRTLAPAAFADGPDSARSDKYTFVSSKRIINSMDELNWGVVRAEQPKSKISDPNHSKHTIVFRNRDIDGWEDPRQRVINHGQYHLDVAKVYPEIVLYNSSDGSYRYKFIAGLFALICANGLTISTTELGNFVRKHMGFDPEDAYNVINDFTSTIDSFADNMERMVEYELNDSQRLDYANDAKFLRWTPEQARNISSESLLSARREFDKGHDLWTTFNVVQENLIRGGAFGGPRKSRELSNIVRKDVINRELWAMTENYLLN